MRNPLIPENLNTVELYRVFRIRTYWARISVARSFTSRDREIISEIISLKVQPTAEHAKTAEVILSAEGGKKIYLFYFFSALSAISAVNYCNFP
jgi:hypothetical protein